ncbi:MAG: TIR domain-containing protein, partial [Clostridia bacterium]|nr:TIR domain-containing protein [Clostridia bacterium]
MENEKMEFMFCTNCGSNSITFENNIYSCQSCGSKFEKKQVDSKMFVDLRLADNYRQSTHFDEAKKLYKKIIEDYPDDNLTDVYWGLFLCEQNVIFEDDGKGEKFPSFYKINSQSVEDTPSYLKAITYASKHDIEKVKVFNDLGERIEYARKMYLDIANTTNPFEIFICFKNTDQNGNHTQDRQLAMDIYNEFSGKYNIFFSEKTLKNIKSNYREYEPNIYYGLYTDKIMLLICSRNEYIESKWLKNEWSRFTQINSNKQEKKCIIPIFTDGYNPNDLPSDLQSIQGIFDDRKLISNLEHQLDSIIHPVDKFEELRKQQEEERLRQEQRLAEIASNISRINMGGNGNGENKVNNYIDAIKKFLELENFTKVKESLDLLKGISPNMFEVYWYSMFYDNKCKSLDSLSQVPKIVFTENFKTCKSFASLPEQKTLIETLENKYFENIRNLTKLVQDYYEKGNYKTFVDFHGRLAKYDVSSFEFKFFNLIKSKDCGTYEKFALVPNVLISNEFLELKTLAKTEVQKSLLENLETIKQNYDNDLLEKLNAELYDGTLKGLVDNNEVAKVLDWYKNITSKFDAVFLKAIVLKEVDKAVRQLYLNNLIKYYSFLQEAKTRQDDSKNYALFAPYYFSNEYEKCFPSEFAQLLDLPYTFIDNHKDLKINQIEELIQYIEDIDLKPVEDLQKQIKDLQASLNNQLAVIEAKRTIKNGRDYAVCNVFNLLSSVLIVALTLLGSIIYMSGLPIMETKPVIYNILLPIIGLGSLPVIIFMCAKTNIFAGIPLGILVIFVFYVGAGLVSHAPIAFVNMAIQAFVIIRWLIPQLKFYFKKLNFRGAPYVSKKFKR